MSDELGENYIDRIAAEIAALAPECSAPLLRVYALLVLTTGAATTLEHVHDAWAAWQATTRPDHPHLVPFRELSREMQESDGAFADAIRAVARRRARAAAAGGPL